MAHNQHEPYIPASTTLPEITLRALLLSVTLAIVLGAANAYLGLFAGMTVSASIPAAVISMALLRAFFNSNILENNIVQTATSAGESVAAGVIFTIPALIILGTWTRFDYWETTMLAGFGGILGVLFSIPLRRALIVEMPLRFPEGVATAEVLKVGEGAGAGIGHILAAGAIGALFKLGETGLRLWSGVVEGAAYAGGTVLYAGSNLSPALIGVGYIVGRNIAALVFIGGALNWFVAIPLLALLEPVAMDQPPAAAAGALWSTQTRYIGVGAMVVGGLWALVRMRRSLILGIRSGAEAYRKARRAGSGSTLRTERDIPMQWIRGRSGGLGRPSLFHLPSHHRRAGSRCRDGCRDAGGWFSLFGRSRLHGRSGRFFEQSHFGRHDRHHPDLGAAAIGLARIRESDRAGCGNPDRVRGLLRGCHVRRHSPGPQSGISRRRNTL